MKLEPVETCLPVSQLSLGVLAQWCWASEEPIGSGVGYPPRSSARLVMGSRGLPVINTATDFPPLLSRSTGLIN